MASGTVDVIETAERTRMRTWTFEVRGTTDGGVDFSSRATCHRRDLDSAEATIRRAIPAAVRVILLDVHDFCVCYDDGTYTCSECVEFGPVGR